MWLESFALDAGLEAGGGDSDLVAGLLDEEFLEDIGDIALFVDDEDAGLAGHDAVEGDAVDFHELDEVIEGDATVLGSGDAIALELAGIEPL